MTWPVALTSGDGCDASTPAAVERLLGPAARDQQLRPLALVEHLDRERRGDGERLREERFGVAIRPRYRYEAASRSTLCS